MGFTTPTAIQVEAIPAAMNGSDVLACSHTGSGKTAAFLLPILNKLIVQKKRGPRALVLSPTRELAAQICDHLALLAKRIPISSAAVFGGVGMGPQRQAFERGVDIIIATPGRLLDHIDRGYANLNNIEFLVLDEADRMLDMGFLPDVKRIIQRTPVVRQTMFFSATLPPQIASLTREILKKPVTINAHRQGQPAVGIRQHLYPVSHSLKSTLLLKLLDAEGVHSALIFTRTKRRADRVADFLKKNGVAAARIHGDRTQAQRTQAMDGFKSGNYQVLVATDVAARGIDVDALSHVINFDLPGSAEDYVHRIGRTGRADATGDALTFVAPDEENSFRSIERAVGKKIPRVTLEGFDYSAKGEVGEGRGSSGGGGGGYRGGNRNGRGGGNQRAYHSGGNSRGSYSSQGDRGGQGERSSLGDRGGQSDRGGQGGFGGGGQSAPDSQRRFKKFRNARAR